MGTRSGIMMKDGDVFRGIYCHWDGYPGNNGRLLLQYYSRKEKVKELMSLGSLSSLGKYVLPHGKHGFDSPEPGVTVAYHRDRGESWEHCKTVEDEDEGVVKGDLRGSGCEYFYLFRDGQWFMKDIYRFREWAPVVDFLNILDEEEDEDPGE